MNKIALLVSRKAESAEVIVMRHRIFECGCASIVEIRRMLPQAAEGSSAVGLVRGAQSVARVLPGFRRSVQHTGVVVGVVRADVTRDAVLVEYYAASS